MTLLEEKLEMTILLLETIDQMGLALLENAGSVYLSPSPDAHAHALPFNEITAIVTRGLGQVDDQLIKKCPNLKAIARCGAGLNNIDVEAAKKAGIPVVYAPGINASAVAEHSLMLMLSAIRRGFATATEVKDGNWDCRNDFSGDDLANKKICIVGMGNIGRKTAGLCKAFSKNITMFGRDGKGQSGLVENLKEYLPKSDVVSLHIPLNEDTHHLIDAQMMSLMKPGVIFINTSRGEIVDEDALVEKLDDGHIAVYAADVVDGEPPANSHPVIAHANSFVTPHVASLTKSTYQEMCVFTAKNVVAVLTKQTPEPISIFRGAV